MIDFRTIFEQAYPGKDTIYEEIILPISKTAKDLRKTVPIALAESDKQTILQASIIAQVSGTFPITFADVTVQSSVHLKRNRVSIQNCIRTIMKDNTSALIFFHFADNLNEWRVSFVHRAETLKTSTSAKRYTYLCGTGHPCRTIAERFQKLAKKADEGAAITVDDMLDAFSVEALSKEFFAEYKVFYEDFVQYITGKRYIKAKGKAGYENRVVAGAKVHTEIFAHFQRISNGDEQKAEKKVRDYIKKMMGRLVFIQFLQKKGWLGCSDDNWNDGDRDYLQHLFEHSTAEQQNNFLATVLDPLFFGMLNTNPEDRAHHFKQKNWDTMLLDRFGKVPYLNGGLFEEEPEDDVPVVFPAALFGNPSQKETERIFRSSQNDDYPYNASCGLLDFFARYNFTIDETDPEDREVGVDPEMLGKIFENLLEDNKDKGAFYTPKEIVQYMCRESLIAYLAEETQDEPAMRDLVLNHNIQTIKDKETVLSALKNIKICDPAVGSGAFPMGMLNELFACRILLEEDSADEEHRSRIKKEIVRENIYGVDIEKGAVDIARLRFWLAIIVDEKIPLPLPNLDYKIMQGNSLLESYEGISLENLLHQNKNDLFCTTEENIKTLQTAISDYYQPKTHKSKQIMKQHISQLVYALLSEQGWSKAHDKLADLKKIPIDSNSSFFLWHTWFSEVFNRPADCNGFDIVIGNPPYVSAPNQVADKRLLKQREQLLKFGSYKTLYQKWDLYIPFIEKSLQLLKDGGIYSPIVPYPVTNQNYAKRIRQIIINNYDLFEITDLKGIKVFESATVTNCILFIKKGLPRNRVCISNFNLKQNNIKVVFTKSYTELVQDEQTVVWNLTQEIRNVNRHANMYVLGDFCYISVGMVLNSDENSNDEKFTKADLISEMEDNVHWKKFIEAKDIEKYSINRIRYLEYGTKRCPSKVRRQTFPELYSTKKLLFNRLGSLQVVVDKKGNYTTSDAMFVAILWEDLHGVENKSITASIKKFSHYTRNEMEKFSEKINLLYILAIMNSYYANILLTNIRGGDYHIYPEHIRNIPIPSASKEQQQPIIDLVDQILIAKKKNSHADTRLLEYQIDQLVYKLYDLTQEEINNIEQNKG
jgi:type II restriction-modification enzyme